MKRSLKERNELVTVVRSRTSIVAWVTEKGVIIFDPCETKLTLLVGADGSFFDGVDDGQETFLCQAPDCPDPVRSVDETCYVNLWKRARKQMN